MQNILNPKAFRLLVFIILVSFAGCVTSRIEYVKNDNLSKKKTYRLAEAYMNDGSVIDLKDKESKFKTKYKGMVNVIVHNDKNQNELYIQLKDINKLKIEIIESNTVLNVIIIAGSVILFVLLILIIAFSTIEGESITG